MPKFSEKIGKDPQVHVHAFKDWAEYKIFFWGKMEKMPPTIVEMESPKVVLQLPPWGTSFLQIIIQIIHQKALKGKERWRFTKRPGQSQTKKWHHPFVENINDMVRQLSFSPSNKNLRAWFLIGNLLKKLARSKITKPTKTFEEFGEKGLNNGEKKRPRA